MTESKNHLCHIMQFVQLFREQYSVFLKDTFSDNDRIHTTFLGKILLIFPLLLIMVFIWLILLIILIIGLVCIKCKNYILNPNINTFSTTLFTTTIFNEFVVRELLCDVLRNNATEFGIIAPKTVADITPIEYGVLNNTNNITFARFIVAHSNCDEEDFDTFLSLLNSKLSQQIQIRYPDCILLYKELKVVTVFNVTHDLYHNGYYAIDVMVVDNDIKYTYLCDLYRQKRAAQTAVDSSGLNDKDF